MRAVYLGHVSEADLRERKVFNLRNALHPQTMIIPPDRDYLIEDPNGGLPDFGLTILRATFSSHTWCDGCGELTTGSYCFRGGRRLCWPCSGGPGAKTDAS